MTVLHARELRIHQQASLTQELADQRELLRAARFELSQGRGQKTRVVREARQNIARILTILRERARVK